MGADFAAPAGKKALGRPRVVPLRGVIDALLYFFGRRVRGVCRRAIFRSARPCNDTFMPGRPKGYWKRSISCWSNRLGSAVAAKPAHPADIQDRDGAGFDPLPLPMAAPSLRPSRGRAFADGAYARATSWRQRLPGAAVDAGQAIRPGPRFLSIAQAMGRRADLRLVWTQSPADEGL
jgi:hypothetical protein